MNTLFDEVHLVVFRCATGFTCVRVTCSPWRFCLGVNILSSLHFSLSLKLRTFSAIPIILLGLSFSEIISFLIIAFLNQSMPYSYYLLIPHF